MSVLVIHEHEVRVQKSEEDKTAEMIKQAVKNFEEDVKTWPELASEDRSFDEGQMICLSIADDYRKVVTVDSSTEHFFTFSIVANEHGKRERGLCAFNWSVLKDARYKLVECKPDEVES